MPTTDRSRLPEKPDLACERKRAKTLLPSFDSDAINRFRSYHPRFADLTAETLRPTSVQLNDAQWVIAREYGFPRWPALKAHIEQVCAQSATEQRAAFSVVVLNDDATPMDFVVHLLQEVFEKSEDEARHIMLDTHTRVRPLRCLWSVGESRIESRCGHDSCARASAPTKGDVRQWRCRIQRIRRETSLAPRLEKDHSMARAKRVRFDGDAMLVELVDGRTLSAPLAWIPKLESSSPHQLQQYETSIAAFIGANSACN
jgi:hypothetical protein